MERGKKNNRGGIEGPIPKEKEGDGDDSAAKLWDKHDFNVGGKEGAEWGNGEKY